MHVYMLANCVEIKFIKANTAQNLTGNQKGVCFTGVFLFCFLFFSSFTDVAN